MTPEQRIAELESNFANMAIANAALADERDDLQRAMNDAIELMREIMRDEVNHQDEAEKWLRAYQHLKS